MWNLHMCLPTFWSMKKIFIEKLKIIKYILTISSNSSLKYGMKKNHHLIAFKTHLSIGSLVLTPSIHDKRIVDRDTGNAANSLRFQSITLLNKAWKMCLQYKMFLNYFILQRVILQWIQSVWPNHQILQLYIYCIN